MSIDHLHAVPNLTSALTWPLLTIEQHLLERQAAIEAWLRSQWLETPAPFYCSVDLRNAGLKLEPVDTNLFPTGIHLPPGRRVRLEPLVRDGRRRGGAGYTPCMILLNNDLSAGRPAILEDLDQPVIPPLTLGWSDRLKSDHFTN